MGMRHGLLRTSYSRNPKNTSNPLIFLRKMTAFRCFARHKAMLACASAARMTFCRLSHNKFVDTYFLITFSETFDMNILYLFRGIQPSRQS